MTKKIFISADHGMAIIAGLHLPDLLSKSRAVPGQPHAQYVEALRADALSSRRVAKSPKGETTSNQQDF